MKPESPRARRFAFAAAIEVTNLDTGAILTGHTSDLNLYGCRVASSALVPAGTKVRISVTHGGAHFVAFGRVTAVRPPSSFGIVFTRMEPANQLTLEKWITEFRNQEKAVVSAKR